MAFFDDMINGIRGMFGGAPKPQQNNSANNTVRNNLSKGVGFGVFTNEARKSYEDEERRRRAAEEMLKKKAEEERKRKEEEQRRKAEAEARRAQAEALRQKIGENNNKVGSNMELGLQNDQTLGLGGKTQNTGWKTLEQKNAESKQLNSGNFMRAQAASIQQNAEAAKKQAERIKQENNLKYNLVEGLERNFAGQNNISDQEKYKFGKELGTAIKKDGGDNILSGSALEFVNRYNAKSGDEQADIRENLQKLQYKYTQEGGADKAATVNQILSLINKDHNKLITQKDTSLGRQIAKNATTGGFVGDLAKPVENILGTMTGKQAQVRQAQQRRDVDRSNLGAVGGVDKAMGMVGSIGLNATTGGVSQAVNTIGGAMGAGEKLLNEKVLDYDQNGNASIRGHNVDEGVGIVGGEILNAGLSLLGARGIGPNMGSLTDLTKSEIAKEVGKYGAKEVPYALTSAYLSANLNEMANGGKFGEAKFEDIAAEALTDIAADTGMDLRGATGKNRTVGSLKNLPDDVRNLYKYQDSIRNKIITDDKGRYVKGETNELSGISNKKLPLATKKYLETIQGAKFNTDNGTITSHSDMPGKYVYGEKLNASDLRNKLRIAPQLDEVLRATEWVRDENGDVRNIPNQDGKHPEINDLNYGKVRYEPANSNRQYEAIVNVGNNENDKHFYSLDKTKRLAVPHEDGLSVQQASNTSNIPQSSEKVNSDYEYSDSIRNKLSPEQEAFFKDSKVRDENGNLMKVFHGTNADFDTFDLDAQKNIGNNFGKGIYLTTDKEYAKGYAGSDGRVIEGYADIKKPLTLRGNLDDVIMKGVDADRRYYNTLLSQRGYNENVIKKQIANGSISPQDAIEIKQDAQRKLLRDYGYDGIKVDNDTVVAFESNQIKYTDNLNPTDSPDMRYKIQAETNQLTAKLDELKSRHQNLTGDEDLVFNIFKDEIQKNALGYFDPKTNKINLNDLTTDTLNHEIGHKIFSRVPMEQKADLISEIRSTFGDEALISKYGKDYGDDINILAEERLADGFNKYYQGKLNGEDSVRLGTRLGIPPKVLAYYDRMIEAIKSVFGATDELKKFYAEIETGRFAENHFADVGKMVGGEARYKAAFPKVQDSELESDTLKPYGIKYTKSDFNEALDGALYELKPDLYQRYESARIGVEELENNIEFNQFSPKQLEDIFGKNYSEFIDKGVLSQIVRKDSDQGLDQASMRGDMTELDPEEYLDRLNSYYEAKRNLRDIEQEVREAYADPELRAEAKAMAEISAMERAEREFGREELIRRETEYNTPVESKKGIVKGLKTESQPKKRKFDRIAEQFAGQEVPNSVKRDVDMVLAKSRGELRAKSSSQPQGIVKNLKVENQPTDVKEILSNKQFENVPMASDKIMTKGNLYEQVKIGSTKGDWWSKPQRDGDWEYQLHHRKTKDGKKFSQFERRYVGDGDVGEWQPYSRALYMWKTQNKKIDAANDQEAIQDAIATAREDGQIKDYVYRQNHKQEWETVPLTGKVTLDGGFVRDPESGEIIGNHIQVTPFGVVNQIGGKYRVVETDNLVSVDPKKSGVTDTFTRKIEKLMDGESEEYMKGLVDEKRHRYAKFAEELKSFNNEHFELAKRIDKDFRPKNTKEKEFWEDVGRLSENTLQVKGLSGEDAFRSKYGENALIGAKEYTEYMRGNYDRWIKEANEIRRMLGKDEVEYRKNYMPHIEKDKGFFGKMASSVGIKGDLEGESRGEIPAKIAGLTADFSPNKKFNANEQQRTGAMKDYELDPRKVAEQYADLILYNKHMEPLINRGRSVEASMRALDASRSEGLFQDPDSKLKDGGVVDGVHTVAVKDWVDELAGKSSSIDRPLIDRTNRSIQIIRKLENINGANKIMGNISSTFAQALNLPETVRQNGLKNTGKAILDAFNPEARKAMENSPFLKERYVDTGGKFTKTTSQKVSDKVSTWTGMNLVEGAFIRLNWGANYNRLKSKYSGNELIVQTDRATAKTVGARGIGDMPQAYRSALGKIFLQFTYENNESFKNNIEHAKGIVKNLKTGKKAEAGKMALHSAEAYVTAMALNALYGAATGNKPLPEPITEFTGMVADNLDEDEKNDKNAGDFAAKGLEQLGKANPIVGAGLNMLPKDDRKNIFGGESDFGRFDGATGVAQTASNAIKGGINLLGGNIDDATTNLAGLIPMGSQIKKTVGGVSTMVKGEHTKTDKNGKEQTVYKVDNSNPLKWAQAAVFGRNALSETQDHYAGKDQKKQAPSAENTGSLNELSMKFAEERQARLKDDENYKNSAAKLIDDMAIKIGKGEVRMDENGLLRNVESGKIETNHYEKLTKALRKEGSDTRDVYKDYLNSYEGRELEYSEFKKEYDEKVASGEYSKKQQIKEKQKLDRLEAQKDWEKEYRDAYSLSQSADEIESYYALYQTDEERNAVRGKLNAINDRMLEKGLISQKTYNSRYKNINGIESSSKSSRGRKGSSEDTFTAPSLPNFKVGSAPKIKSTTTAGRGIVKGLKVDSSKAQISVNSLPKAKISIK